MADDDTKDRDDQEEEPSDAEKEKVREAEEEGGEEERVEADFTSQDRLSHPFNPDEPGVAPPDSTHNKPA
jgi:hypothetical protein